MPLTIQLHLAGFNAGDMCGLGHEPAKPLRFLIDDGQEFVALSGVGNTACEQRCRCRAYRGQWRFELVSQAVQQGRLEFLTLARRFGPCRELAAARIFQTDLHEIEQSVKRGVGKVVTLNCNAASVLPAETERRNENAGVFILRLRARQRDLFQLRLEFLQVASAAVICRVVTAIVDRNCRYFADSRKLIRDVCSDRTIRIHHHDRSAQRIQALHLHLARARLDRAPLRGVGQLAGNERAEQKCKEGNPVFGVRNRQCSDRREEEVAEANRRCKRRDDGFRKTPRRGDQQHRDQISKPHCCRIDNRYRPEHERHQQHRRQRHRKTQLSRNS